jgi:glyceraldehyde 3-phosphate dehydrogenase
MIKIGINGFGRIGRLAFRAVVETNELTVVAINDPAGDAHVHAHLLNFDSIQGRWHHEAVAQDDKLIVDRHAARCTNNRDINDTDWSQCDVVLEASGKMRQKD